MWDDELDAVPSASAAPVLGSSNSYGGGMSVGRGRGFSSKLPNGNQVNSQPGWQSASATTNSYANDDSGWQEDDDSGWNESASTNTVSDSNWKESTNDGGWKGGSSSYSSYGGDRNGGFDSSRSNKVCFKCNQEGHFSRNCPANQRQNKHSAVGKGKGCFKCGEEGHMSRDCPSSGGGRGGGGRSCHKCGEEGHMARECPTANDGGGARRGGGGRGCHKCGEEGHMARDCTSAGSDSRGKGCFKCGEDGHMSRDCPSAGGNSRGKGCFKCGEEGHMSRDCPSAGSDSRGKGCFKCGEDGHMSRDCPSGGDSGEKRSKGCHNCGEDGHFAKDCPNPDKRVGPDGKPRAPLYIPPELPDDASTLFESVAAGINFSKYERIPVDVSGTNVPPALSTFESSGLSQHLLKNVRKSGYTVPTPVQKHAIPIIMQKRDLMACAETGSGKTAAFLLPIISEMLTDPNLPNNANHSEQEPWAVIISPTRELAIQIMTEAKKFSYDSIVKAEVIYGGTSTAHQTKRIERGIHILVATPGRLLDFVEKKKVSLEKIKYFVLDEADRMLDMGFMPSIEKMVDMMPPKGQRHTLMFSATFAEEIQTLASKFLEDYLFLTVGTVGGANSDVQQTFFKLGQYEKRQKLMDILKESGKDRVLVFVEQKRTADFLASLTSQEGIPTTSIHGDRLQQEREEALRDFRIGRMPVLVATAVAARGLDIKDVCHVVNYDLPQSIDEYVHRIGRTGRVGNLGKATSFYDPDTDQALARSLKKILIDANQDIPDWLHDEANQATGTAPQYGRGNFGGRDVRSQGRSRGGGGGQSSSDMWDNDTSGGNQTSYSQPIETDEIWD